MEIKQIPLNGVTDRQFIRFSVFRVPIVSSEGQIMPYGLQWRFEAIIRMDDKYFGVDWYQPESENEPSPDPRCFLPCLFALLSKISEKFQ